MVGNDNGQLRTNRTLHRKLDEMQEQIVTIVDILQIIVERMTK